MESDSDKVKALSEAVKGLAREVERLQDNLNRLHEFQVTLYHVSKHWLEWLERSNRLLKAVEVKVDDNETDSQHTT